MNLHIQAIFEHGVLRPLEPLNLGEHQVVSVSIETGTSSAANKPAEKMSVEEKQAILALLDEMERMPDRSPLGDFSQIDHDQVIYGLRK